MSDEEYKKAVEWLSQARHIDREIIALREELNDLNDKKFSIGGLSLQDKVQHSASSDAAYTSIVHVVAEREAELRDKIASRKRVKIEIGRMIDKIENTLIATVLREYYINGKRITEIATSENYSEKQVLRLKRKGVEMVADIIAKCP